MLGSVLKLVAVIFWMTRMTTLSCLACALAAQTDLIVSGNRDLLSLKNHQGIDILTAPNLLAQIPGE